MVDINSLSYYNNLNYFETPMDNTDRKKMSFVICLGLPGSGKSTFSTQLQQRLNEAKVSCTSVSRDAIRIQEDGSYLYDPEREPLVQDAHLELLYQLAEQRKFDVVIVDDANLRYSQVISTLLAIDNPENDVMIVNFEPFSPYRHLDRTRKNGHLMLLECLVYLIRSYNDTNQRIKDLDIKTFTVSVEEPKDLKESFDLKQKTCVTETVNKVLERILKGCQNRFTLLDYRILLYGELKRHLFEQYKESIVPKSSCAYPNAPKRAKLLAEEDEEEESEDEVIDEDN